MVPILPERDAAGWPATVRLLAVAVLLLAGGAAAPTPPPLTTPLDPALFPPPSPPAVPTISGVAAMRPRPGTTSPSRARPATTSRSAALSHPPIPTWCPLRRARRGR